MPFGSLQFATPRLGLLLVLFAVAERTLALVVVSRNSAGSLEGLPRASTHNPFSNRRRFVPKTSLHVVSEFFTDTTTSPIARGTTNATSSFLPPLTNGVIDGIPDNYNDAETSATNENILTFRSSFSQDSDPIKVPENLPASKLGEFLLHPDHLLAAGTSVDSRIVPLTDALMEEWRTACCAAKVHPPDPHRGVVMAHQTAGISLPGISIRWSAIMGTTLVDSGVNNNNYPELEYVLIKDETKATGAKPLVWIYDKLSSRKKSEKKQQQQNRRRRSGESFPSNGSSNGMDTKLVTRLGFYPYDDDDNNSIMVIRCDGNMEMNFRIPSVLRKLLMGSSSSSKGGETPKQKAERKVSALITKQIEKDTAETVANWEDNFRAWLDKHQPPSDNKEGA